MRHTVWLAALLCLTLAGPALAYNPQNRVERDMARAIKQSDKLSRNAGQADRQQEAAAQQVFERCLPALKQAGEQEGPDAAIDLESVLQLAVLRGSNLSLLERNNQPVIDQYTKNSEDYYLPGAPTWLSSYRYQRSLTLTPESFCEMADQWAADNFDYKKIPRELGLLISLADADSHRFSSPMLREAAIGAFKAYRKYGVSRRVAENFVILAFAPMGSCASDACEIISGYLFGETFLLLPFESGQIVYSPSKISVTVRSFTDQAGAKLETWISPEVYKGKQPKLCSAVLSVSAQGSNSLTCAIEGRAARRLQQGRKTDLELHLKHSLPNGSDFEISTTITLGS